MSLNCRKISFEKNTSTGLKLLASPIKAASAFSYWVWDRCGGGAILPRMSRMGFGRFVIIRSFLSKTTTYGIEKEQNRNA